MVWGAGNAREGTRPREPGNARAPANSRPALAGLPGAFWPFLGFLGFPGLSWPTKKKTTKKHTHKIDVTILPSPRPLVFAFVSLFFYV